MPDFLVTVNYNPGKPVSYIVEGVATHEAARARVLEILRYDPGVPVEVTQTPININKPVRYSNFGAHFD